MSKPSYEQLAFENELLKKQLNQNESHLDQLFNLIIEEASQGIFVVQDNKLQYTNSKFLELLGYKYSDLSDIHFAEFIHPDYRDQVISIFNKLHKKEPGTTDNIDIWVITENEEKRCLQMDLKLVDWDKHMAIMSFVRDITEYKNREQQISEAESRIEESLKLRSSLASSISHDIRTPMTAIIGFTDLLSDPSLSEDLRMKYVQYINRSGNLLLNLIDNIIDMVRMEAGQLDIKKRIFPLNKLMDSIHKQYQHESEKTENADIKFWLKKASEEQLNIYSDPDKIHQVISNLLENAFKYTKQGYIEFGYDPVKDNKIRFYVKDTGVGIDHSKQAVIFEQVFKVKDKATKNIGSGLGLPIARQMVERLGGKITVDSKPEQGSSFSFWIPYEKSIKETTQATPGKKSSIKQWQDKVILVAEDVETNFVFVEAALRKTKAKVIRACNGLEALNYIRENPVDIVLMDIQMPEMNGYDATRNIRKDFADLPIIAQTAFAMEGEREKSIDAGCNDYLSKPIKLNQLLSTIEKYL